MHEQERSTDMSQCIGCANQPSDSDSLGGAAHEGTATPMVVGIIIGTIAVFILVVCALFYCVKLENNKHTAKIGDACGTGGEGMSSDDDPRDEQNGSIKSRPSSVTVVPPIAGAKLEEQSRVGAEAQPRQSGRAGDGVGKRRLFAWGRKSGEFLPVLYRTSRERDF